MMAVQQIYTLNQPFTAGLCLFVQFEICMYQNGLFVFWVYKQTVRYETYEYMYTGAYKGFFPEGV